MDVRYGQAVSPISSARQASLRTANLALVASQVLASPTPVSRADVAAATGMTRSTASRLADELICAGILTELEPATGSGPGRPAVPLAPASGTFVALGMEVGVTHLTVRAIDLAGELIAERVIMADLAGSDPRSVVARLAALVADVLALAPVRRARLVGARLALPGLVSGSELLRAPNLEWDRCRPGEELAAALAALPDASDLPTTLTVSIGNEANLGALTVGRNRPAAPGHWPSFIYLSGENGIGAGIVRDGRADVGTSGFAGEIGHIQVDPAGPSCPCGNRGCVERYAGRRAILAAAGMPASAGPEQLLAAWEDGDEAAQQAVSQAATALGVGLAAAVNLLDVPVVVLGGHLAPLGEILRPRLEAELNQRVLASGWTHLEITHTDGDQMPAATGAAWSLLEEVVADPAAWTD